ncbi:MAG: sensor histidine kinase [Blastocatellia bacterium]|nr:sensor histidine kinase [Blastocatellia bacterium]
MLDQEATTGAWRPWKKWLLVICLWLLPALLSFSQTLFVPPDERHSIVWYKVLGLQSLFWFPLAFSTPVIFHLGTRFPIERPRRLKALSVHLFACTVYSFAFTAWLVFFYELSPDASMAPLRSLPLLTKFFIFLSGGFTFCFPIYGAVLGISAAVDYYRKFQERERAAAAFELKASQLEGQLAQAHLRALKMQLHPHFLFNTLHSIAALVREDDKQGAIRMIAGLSDLLRMALEEVGARETTLKQEMEFLEKYLAIEQIRFQDRLKVRIEIEPETLDATVPYLILQPIVENAIRHGISKRASASLVEIRAWREGGHLFMQVRDDGPGLAEGWTAPAREGIGIKNTRARLEQLYGRAHSFSIENGDGGGAVATIIIPFTMKERSEDDGHPSSAIGHQSSDLSASTG